MGDFGAWDIEDANEAVRYYSGIGADSDLPDHIRFFTGVAKLAKKCLFNSRVDQYSEEIGVFLLSDHNLLKDRSAHKVHHVPFLDSGETQISGKLWTVSAPVNNGYFIELDRMADDELVNFIKESLGLGACPTVIFNPRTSPNEVRFYEHGLNDLERCVNTTIAQVEISLEKIFAAIDLIYSKMLATPDYQNDHQKLWEDSDRFCPKENAELMIQGYLRTGLTTAFPTCTIRKEATNVSGRLDLEVEESVSPGIFVRHAILELKVLRSFSSSGKTVKSERDNHNWVKEGVEQAYSYRRERLALKSALCCFDMRKDDLKNSCFDHVLEMAKKLDVELWRWYLYASSKAYRRSVSNHS